jgi:UDP-glucose 4-epimerase
MMVIDRNPSSPNYDFVRTRAFCNSAPLAEVDKLRGYDAVVHLAADISVAESTQQPVSYWLNNVGSTAHLLSRLDAGNLIFASTGTAAQPNNAYAHSKLACEHLITDVLHSSSNRPESATMFRFFNVSGCQKGLRPTGPATHLIRIAAEVARGERPFMHVYGTDYNTVDGTAVRDYIHVSDIVAAIKQTIDDPHAADPLGWIPGPRVAPDGPYLAELGRGHGSTVMEVITTMQKVSGKEIPVVLKGRRPGDVPSLYAEKPSHRYQHTRSLEDMCLSAYLYG